MAPPGYPMQVVNRARELYDAGWTCWAHLARLMAKEFDPAPSEQTIKRWIDPDHAECERMRRWKGGSPGPTGGRAWSRRLRRMKELRSLGLSYRSIAAVVSHDFNLALEERQAEAILRERLSQRSVEALLGPEGVGA